MVLTSFTAAVVRVRALEALDESLLPHFLAVAAHEKESEVVLANPALAIYVAGWGREGDCGVVAEDEETGVAVGMAWARFWTADHHGFGWVDERTPEMAVAVERDFQGRGIGGRLVEELKANLRLVSIADLQGDVFSPVRVALSVRADSPAVGLYERTGFEKLEGSEICNRAGGVSFNMIALL